MTYRYKGHSLSDPLTYRDRDELKTFMDRDPLLAFAGELIDAEFPKNQGGKITEDEIKLLKEKAYNRNSAMAIIAAKTPFPADDSLLSFVFSEKKVEDVPSKFRNSKTLKPLPRYKRDEKGRINTRLAIREALIEEMKRDRRVIIFGEDIADYGGAFGVTNELLSVFGRNRVFNSSILTGPHRLDLHLGLTFDNFPRHLGIHTADILMLQQGYLLLSMR